MKKSIFILCLFICLQSFSQSTGETEILKLSNQIFKWEVENNTNELDKLFHEKFVVVGSDGNSQTKSEYLPKLKNGSFLHDSIMVEENKAMVEGNTAIVIGKGRFAVRVSGKKLALHLSYIEVFTRPSTKQSWQVLAMKASIL